MGVELHHHLGLTLVDIHFFDKSKKETHFHDVIVLESLNVVALEEEHHFPSPTYYRWHLIVGVEIHGFPRLYVIHEVPSVCSHEEIAPNGVGSDDTRRRRQEILAEIFAQFYE